MNKFTVLINNQDFTQYVPFPIKWQVFLDERLDEGCLTLLQVKDVEVFKPLTDVQIKITDENGTELKVFDMLVSNDKAEEIPSGSGKYNHELYLIELTKWLEGFMCRSIGFTNPLGRIYDGKTWYGGDREPQQ